MISKESGREGENGRGIYVLRETMGNEGGAPRRRRLISFVSALTLMAIFLANHVEAAPAGTARFAQPRLIYLHNT